MIHVLVSAPVFAGVFGTVTSFVSAKVIKLSVAVTSFFLPAAVTQLNSISGSEMALVI